MNIEIFKQCELYSRPKAKEVDMKLVGDIVYGKTCIMADLEIQGVKADFTFFRDDNTGYIFYPESDDGIELTSQKAIDLLYYLQLQAGEF